LWSTVSTPAAHRWRPSRHHTLHRGGVAKQHLAAATQILQPLFHRQLQVEQRCREPTFGSRWCSVGRARRQRNSVRRNARRTVDERAAVRCSETEHTECPRSSQLTAIARRIRPASLLRCERRSNWSRSVEVPLITISMLGSQQDGTWKIQG
jgi:hypothetical protein